MLFTVKMNCMTTGRTLGFIFLVSVLSALAGSASAKDLIIESIVIKKHPIPAPYCVYFAASANAGRSKASYHIAHRTYGSGGLEGPEIEIPVNLTLKDVQENEWATVTLHLDPKDDLVTTNKALKKHSGKIEISNRIDHATGKPSYIFIVTQDVNQHFIYQVIWRVE
jgi:hypothetical protein